eukprot:3054935-Rhodomonas_salina.3
MKSQCVIAKRYHDGTTACGREEVQVGGLRARLTGTRDEHGRDLDPPPTESCRGAGSSLLHETKTVLLVIVPAVVRIVGFVNNVVPISEK